MAIKDTQRLQVLNQTLRRMYIGFASSIAVARGYLDAHRIAARENANFESNTAPCNARIVRLILYKDRVGSMLEYARDTNNLVRAVHFTSSAGCFGSSFMSLRGNELMMMPAC